MSFGPNEGGQPGRFEAAQHVNPGARGFLVSLLKRVGRALRIVPPDQTTEQGAAASASPSTYQFGLLALRYDRRNVIQDCRQMVRDDPRAKRSTLKFAREAVAGGLEIRVTEGSAYQKRVKKIAKETEALFPPTKLLSFAWMQIVEGDLFVQAVIDQTTRKIVAAKRMPAVSMERNVNDTDEFVNPEHAFSQMDIITNEEIATFPAAVIYHGRWCHVDGEPYGEPEIAAGRRLRRLLDVMEEAQAIRRMTRANKPNLWNVGTEEHPGSKEEVQAFRDQNGFVEGRREIFDPTEVARDYFANGMVSLTSPSTDSTVSDVDDILHFQNVYASAALPTPPPLYNLDATSVNRDVLDDLRAEYLKETQTLSWIMTEIVDWAFKLNLLLAGILPETTTYKVHFKASTPETPSEVIESTTALHGAGLMSTRTAIQRVQPYTGVVDLDEEQAIIEEEIRSEQAGTNNGESDPDMPATPVAQANGLSKVGAGSAG